MVAWGGARVNIRDHATVKGGGHRVWATQFYDWVNINLQVDSGRSELKFV